MSAPSLDLPQATSCPVCGKLIQQVRVKPVFKEETGELETIVVICPHCGMKYNFDVNTMARAVALEAMKRLQEGQ